MSFYNVHDEIVMVLSSFLGFYIRNVKPLPIFCGWAGRFASNLVENPEDRFSRDVVQIFSKIYGNKRFL